MPADIPMFKRKLIFLRWAMPGFATISQTFWTCWSSKTAADPEASVLLCRKCLEMMAGQDGFSWVLGTEQAFLVSWMVRCSKDAPINALC